MAHGLFHGGDRRPLRLDFLLPAADMWVKQFVAAVEKEHLRKALIVDKFRADIRAVEGTPLPQFSAMQSFMATDKRGSVFSIRRRISRGAPF